MYYHQNNGETQNTENAKVESGAFTDAVSYLSSMEFSFLQGSISKPTLQAVTEMGFTKMTEIQAKCIKPLLEVNSFACFLSVFFIVRLVYMFI